MKWNEVWAELLRRDAGDFLKSRDELHHSSTAPRVLMATGIAGYPVGALVESSLAVALTLRGARVDVLVCDGVLPACQQSDLGDLPAPRNGRWPQPRCQKCFTQGSACYAPLGLELLQYGDYLDAGARTWARTTAAAVDFDDIETFEVDGVRVGEHAYAGALRHFARGELTREPGHEGVLRSYLEAALLTVRCMQRLLDERSYSVVCFHHGIYVPQGLVGEVCRRRGVRVVNWNPAYRDHCFVFSHGDTYHRTMISEPVGLWENMELTPAMRAQIEQYLENRRTGSGDWIWFHAEPDKASRPTVADLGVDTGRPFVSLLTSVIWDAQLHYDSNAFENMLEWLFETVEYFRAHPDRQLVIRVHPAEITGNIPSRQTVMAELGARFASLPANVFVVPPGSHLSTYDLIEESQAVLVFHTKTGIEIASRGVPVVVAGDAWIRSKGFSLDASSKDEYVRILDELPRAARLDPHLHTRALKYAYHFFFRRMIPLSFIHSREKFQFELSLASVRDLLPGKEAGLDCICDGVLHGTPFVFESSDAQAAKL